MHTVLISHTISKTISSLGLCQSFQRVCQAPPTKVQLGPQRRRCEIARKQTSSLLGVSEEAGNDRRRQESVMVFVFAQVKSVHDTHRRADSLQRHPDSVPSSFFFLRGTIFLLFFIFFPAIGNEAFDSGCRLQHSRRPRLSVVQPHPEYACHDQQSDEGVQILSGFYFFFSQKV